MKLNKTYALKDVLDAVSHASQTVKEGVDYMKKEGIFSTELHCFRIEGALTTSPYARVTFTHRDNDGNTCGYMETGAFTDGVRTPIKVIESWDVIKANEDYSKITFVK